MTESTDNWRLAATVLALLVAAIGGLCPDVGVEAGNQVRSIESDGDEAASLVTPGTMGHSAFAVGDVVDGDGDPDIASPTLSAHRPVGPFCRRVGADGLRQPLAATRHGPPLYRIAPSHSPPAI